MQGENSLYPHAIRDFSHGESTACSRPGHLDHDALEGLDSLLLPLHHLDLNPQRIANAKRRQVGLEILVFKFPDDAIHW